MNCPEFRRHCLAEPGATAPEYRKHRAECPACAEFAARVFAFDHELLRAVSIDPPENLQSGILQQQSMQSAKWRPIAAYLSMAATVLLAVMLVFLLPGPGGDGDIEQLVVAYLEDAPATVTSTGHADTMAADHLLRPLGMELQPEFGPIKSARPCVIRGNEAVHMVLAGNLGMVDIVFMPSEFIDERIMTAYRDRDMLIVPCPRGTIAIVGYKGEHLVAIERKLFNASRWL